MPLLLPLVTAAPCASSTRHTSSFPRPAAAVRARESTAISTSACLPAPSTHHNTPVLLNPHSFSFSLGHLLKAEWNKKERKYFPHRDFSPSSILLILCFKQNLQFKFCCLCLKTHWSCQQCLENEFMCDLCKNQQGTYPSSF